MQKNSYKGVMWQHNMESLCYTIWSDDNLVQTLSSFFTLKGVEGGIKRKRKVNDICERESAAVPCPQKNIDYSNMFHQIDNGNGVEAKYNLAGQGSRKHKWSLKLSL